MYSSLYHEIEVSGPTLRSRTWSGWAAQSYPKRPALAGPHSHENRVRHIAFALIHESLLTRLVSISLRKLAAVSRSSVIKSTRVIRSCWLRPSAGYENRQCKNGEAALFGDD